MSDNEYSDEEYGFDDDDYQEGGVDDDDSDKEDIEQETGEDEINEADDDRDEEKQSQSCHQYPRYPAYVEAKVEMKMSNMRLDENGEEKKRAAQKTKQ